MSKEHMAIHLTIEALAPAMKLVKRTLVEEKPFANYRHALRVEGHQTEWTFHLLEASIGRAHAALATQLTIVRYQPQLSVNAGVSGRPYTGAQIGDLCLSIAYRYRDVWCGEGNERGQVQGIPVQYSADATVMVTMAKQLRIPLHGGLFLCGDTFIPRTGRPRALTQQYPGLVTVDMESATITQTAYLYHTPFVSLRIVSDTPLTSQDHSKQYASF